MTKIAVIGAGIGGLTTACLLAQAGFEVTVYEGQAYPGGCASTFTHQGYRFDAGATVVGGFQPNGPHAIVGDKLNLTWPVHKYDPAWVVHMPGREIPLTQDNTAVLENFPHSATFWEQQSRIAELGWSLSAQGLPWPPTNLTEAMQIASVGVRNLPQDLRIIPFALMSAKQWLRQHNLHHDLDFVRFLDGQLLISAQTTTDHAYALYSATALDLARQGVYHAEGGIGGVAQALVDKLHELGGEVRYKHHVTRIVVENDLVTGLETKRNRRSTKTTFQPANFVIANVPTKSLQTLLGDSAPAPLVHENQHQRIGYGAFVLHLGLRDDMLPAGFADHHQFLMSNTGGLGEGRSIFMSLSPKWDTTRAPHGERAVTITTHTQVEAWWRLQAQSEAAYEERKAAYAKTIIRNISQFVPNFREAITFSMAGSPTTYAYYTARHRGMVGGLPQTSLFRARGPRTGISNLRLVGDAVFPGQSTAGVSLGAMRVSEDVMRQLGQPHATYQTSQTHTESVPV